MYCKTCTLKHIPKIATTSSALGYFAVRSGFCAAKIVKSGARESASASKVAFRVTLVGHEASARRFSPRCIHDRPNGCGKRPRFDSRHRSFSGTYTRWLSDADWFSGLPVARIVIDRALQGLRVISLRPTFFFRHLSLTMILREMYFIIQWNAWKTLTRLWWLSSLENIKIVFK